MTNPRLASRYAKSILDLAIEKGQLEAVYADMQYLQQVIKASPDFLSLLRSPVIPSDKKQKVIDSITGTDISAMTATFLRLLISKTREGELPEIIAGFIQQYKSMKDIHTVKLTTATPISEEVKASLVEQVRKTSKLEKIELETAVNPDLIGGFTLQTGDQLVDASIAYELQEISRQFENNDFIYKII